MDSNVIDLTGDGKVTKVITKEGNGEKPKKTDKVTVHYTGKFTDGTKFDSSRDEGKPFQFQLGKGKVIKGWDVGIASMTKGECATLTLHHDYGYGKKVYGDIPARSTLIFDCELIDFGK